MMTSVVTATLTLQPNVGEKELQLESTHGIRKELRVKNTVVPENIETAGSAPTEHQYSAREVGTWILSGKLNHCPNDSCFCADKMVES
jgi:hypothetical protein